MSLGSRGELMENYEVITRDHPKKLAIANEREALNFTALFALSSQLEKIIEKHSSPGQTLIAFAINNGPAALAIELAIWSQGHIALALPPKVKQEEANSYLSVVTPDLIVVQDNNEQSSWIKATSDTSLVINLTGKIIKPATKKGHVHYFNNDDILQIQFTSGSSGQPKALAFDATAIGSGINQTKDWYKELPSGNAFSPLPQHHAMGRSVIFELLFSEMGVVTTDTMLFGEHVKAIKQHGCETVICSPTYLRFTLQLNLWKSLDFVKHLILGTASTEAKLVDDIRSKLSHPSVDIRYGVSEAIGALTRLQITPDDEGHETGYVGLPLPLVKIYAPDLPNLAGEVTTSSPTTACALIVDNQIKPLEKGSRLPTGDLGNFNKNKGLRLSGRSNIFLKHMGYKIDPIEIESTILDSGLIPDVVVVGIPDDTLGQKIVAVSEKRISGSERKKMLDICSKQLSSYKVPSDFLYLNEIPKLPSGKTDRKITLKEVISILQT